MTPSDIGDGLLLGASVIFVVIAILVMTQK